jgi:hypothetical protein
VTGGTRELGKQREGKWVSHVDEDGEEGTLVAWGPKESEYSGVTRVLSAGVCIDVIT